MTEKYYLEIVDNGSVYALCEYQYTDLAEVLSNIKRIIDNYNKNLCKTSLPNMPLALRMLQVENEEGNSGMWATGIKSNSAEMLSLAYRTFKPLAANCVYINSGAATDLPLISVDKNDMSQVVRSYRTFAEIDIENKNVVFHYFVETMTEEEYKKKHVWTSFSDLETAKYSMDDVPFNAIEEFGEFVAKKTYGSWIDPHDPDRACSIIK